MPEIAAAPYAFVSYASVDRDRVLPVVAALRAAGVTVWLDEQGIAGGENYAAEIAEAIKGAAALLLLASPASLASRNVKQEIALGWRYARPYLPLRLDPVAIPDDLAYWLEAAQWVDLLGRPASIWLPQVLAALAPHGIAPAPALPPPVAALAGRERELALLHERLAGALAGQGGLVLVGGEAGIGKTTLTEALLAEATAQGALALTGRCYDLSETPPYGPWVEVTRAYTPAGGLPAPPAALTERAAAAQVASQAALFDQIAAWFTVVAAIRPVVVLLDDLHWADPASLDLLRVIARHAPALRLLLLATYRSDELTRRHPLYALLPLLDREAHATRLDLRRFDSDALRDLLAARYPLPGEDTVRLVTWLHDRAAGNAFFTSQLLRALEDEGVLAATTTGWALGDLGTVGLPAALRQVLDARLARLGEEAERLLALAAVIGQEVPLALWAAVTEIDEDGLLDTVERAVEARLLTESPDGTAVRFAHALIREALYDGMMATRRRRVHRRVAETLEAVAQPDPDAVAYHYQRAGDPRAAAWLVRAGERAQAAYAWLTAAARYEAALPLLDKAGGDPRIRILLCRRLAQTRFYAEVHQGLAYLEEAFRLADALGDAALTAAVQFERGMVRGAVADVRRSLAEMRAGVDGLALLPASDRAQLAREAYLGTAPDGDYYAGLLVLRLGTTGRYAEALTRGEPLVAALTGAELPASHAHAHSGLAVAYAALGRPNEAQRASALSRRIYQATGHFAQVCLAAGRELIYLALPYAADDLTARHALIAVMREAEAAAGWFSWQGMFGHVAFLEGQWAALQQAITEDPRLTVHHAGRLIPATTLLAPLARAQGERERGWALVREWLPDGPDTTPGDSLIFLPILVVQRVAIELALDAGDLPVARAWLEAHDRWLAWPGEQMVWGRSEGQALWAQYHRALGDLALARERAKQALAHALEPRQPLALLAIYRLLGELDTAAEHHADAGAHLESALALANACAAPYERALTLLARAELRTATGDRLAALADLAEVRAICTPLDARPALARAETIVAHLAG